MNLKHRRGDAIVAIVCMFGSSESWDINSAAIKWRFRVGGGAVHSITTGQHATGARTRSMERDPPGSYCLVALPKEPMLVPFASM